MGRISKLLGRDEGEKSDGAEKNGSVLPGAIKDVSRSIKTAWKGEEGEEEEEVEDQSD